MTIASNVDSVSETDVSAVIDIHGVIVDLERTLRFLMQLRRGEASCWPIEVSPFSSAGTRFRYGRPASATAAACYRCNGNGPCRDCG